MRDMFWVSGDGGGGVGRLFNGVERVGEEVGMLISFVDALTCNMGLIA